jgi:hypothetical protein
METQKQQIEVIKGLIAALDQKNFDLEVWKVKAILLLKSIFGEKDEKIKLVEGLHYDYSSWALRDSSGLQKGDKVKETARQVMDVAITQLSLNSDEPAVIKILRDELTGAQFSELMSCIEKREPGYAALHEFFYKLGAEKSNCLLVKFVINDIQ